MHGMLIGGPKINFLLVASSFKFWVTELTLTSDDWAAGGASGHQNLGEQLGFGGGGMGMQLTSHLWVFGCNLWMLTLVNSTWEDTSHLGHHWSGGYKTCGGTITSCGHDSRNQGADWFCVAIYSTHEGRAPSCMIAWPHGVFACEPLLWWWEWRLYTSLSTTNKGFCRTCPTGPDLLWTPLSDLTLTWFFPDFNLTRLGVVLPHLPGEIVRAIFSQS